MSKVFGVNLGYHTLMPEYEAVYTGGYTRGGEKRLLWAILWRTVNDLFYKDIDAEYIPYLKGRAESAERASREAMRFIMDTSYDPFSFNWICEMLDIDENLARNSVHKLYLEEQEYEKNGDKGLRQKIKQRTWGRKYKYYTSVEE